MAIQDAWQVGRTLAMTDPRLVPVLDGAHQYATYVQFMTAHRHRLSQSDIYTACDSKLQKIIEIEARRLGLKVHNPAHWERVESCLAVPIRCAFWYGWEQVHNLKGKYEKFVAARREQENVTMVCHASAMPQSPIIERIPTGTTGLDGIGLSSLMSQSPTFFERANRPATPLDVAEESSANR